MHLGKKSHGSDCLCYLTLVQDMSKGLGVVARIFHTGEGPALVRGWRTPSQQGMEEVYQERPVAVDVSSRAGMVLLD